ncbi:MAG: hypothetical protein QOH66_2316 [Actinomycetota bacterium]|nr:hypothetical protein [Actinomycetota bacterium]
MRVEPPSHTFLVRIWIEETSDESGHLCWRGQITHLPDEERRHVESFDQIAAFIRKHVAGEAVSGSTMATFTWESDGHHGPER